MPLKIEPHDGGVTISVKVVPGSSRDRIVGELGDALKIAVSAAPEGGKANRSVIRLLAAALGCAHRDVQIVSGHGKPRKRIWIRGLDGIHVAEMLGPLAG